MTGSHDKDTPKVLFLTTRWSRVLLAGDPSQEAAHEALSSLCQDYWRPLYYFARRKGHGAEDAQDLTQGFLARLLEKNGLARADRERGRFRTFLLAAFGHYLATQHRDATALKRGGGQIVLSMDDAEADYARQASHTETPEMHYERSWALALLDRVMARLREEYARAGRADFFDMLQPHLSGAESRPGYAGLGEALGMSASGVAVAVHRMRRRYGELLREEIASTVVEASEVEDEVRHLMRVIS